MFKRTMLPLLVLALFAQTALCTPPVVKTVPWVASNPLIPHDTYSGKTITLKGTCDLQGANITYTWDFGDGKPVASGTVSDRYAIEAKHAYTGSIGLVYTAILTVKNTTTGESSSKNYIVKIQDQLLAVEANIAIDEGLWYLFKTPGRSSGQWYWINNAPYYVDYYINTTASAVQAFEVNGHLESGQPDNPYSEAVRGGIDWLMTTLYQQSISPKSGGVDPDSNHNGYALNIDRVTSRPIYELGAFMDALVASGTPNAIARTGPATCVLGRTYREIVQDMVDMYAFGQYDDANNGSWQYGWGSGSDNSASQWAAIGMIAAERHFGCTVPQWVKDRNKNWLNRSYNGAGYFGYSDVNSGHPFSTGPCGMVQMSFDGFDVTDARWVNCQNYIANNWSSFVSWHDAWYYGCYAFTKAMRVALPTAVVKIGAGAGFDWYGDNGNGLARNLVRNQAADGSWPYDGWPYVGTQTATAWSCLMLSPSLFNTPPVAVAKANPNPAGGGQTVQLDGSASYHPDAGRRIVKYEWDLDNNGSFEYVGPFPTVSFLTAGNYPVTLRVTDDSTPELTSQAVLIVNLNLPPLAPTANANGPYSFCLGVKWFLDGTKSVNPDDGLFDPGCPPDKIISYAWDLSGNGLFTDASGAQPDVSAFFLAKGPGTYLVQLRVTDQTSVSFPASHLPNLVSLATATVVIHSLTDSDCQIITHLIPTSKSGQVKLTWENTGADHYNVYRSLLDGGPYAKIGRTTSASTYLDTTVDNGTTYYYVVRTANDLDQEQSQSNQAVGTPKDIATIGQQPQPSLAEDAGTTVTLSVSATGPEPLSYQWYHDNIIMPLATDSKLVFTSLQSADQGVYTVVITNPGGEVTSSSSTITVLLRDLLPASLVTPAVAVAGRQATVSWTTKNTGNAPASAPWKETVSLADNAAGNNAILLGTYDNTAGIDPLGSAARTLTFDVPPGLFGKYWLFVNVDSQNQVVEVSAENNNIASNPVRITFPEQRALFVNVHGGNYDGDGANFSTTLSQAGASVVYVDLSQNGQVASVLANNAFDQIWVFDLSGGGEGFVSDWQAIANWFNGRPIKNLICDGRSISSYWYGRWQGEGRMLTQNYYENIKHFGGGLVLATDHLYYQSGINTINAMININPFFGDFNLGYIPIDAASPIMNYPNSMGSQLFDDSSPGQTPFGLQPNGLILYSTAWHSGNVNTPGISTTIRGSIGMRVLIASPANGSQYNEEAVVNLSAQPISGVAPFTYAWSSDIDGPLGTGASLALGNLTPGTHRLTLVSTDAGGAADSDAVQMIIVPVAPAMSASLATSSDTGMKNNDGITHVASPNVNFTINKRGIVEFEYTGDGLADLTLDNLTAGNYAPSVGPLVEGFQTVKAVFKPTRGNTVEVDIPVVLDTQGPSVAATIPPMGSILAQAIASLDISFTEDMDPATVSANTVSLTGPTGPIPIAIQAVSASQLHLTFPSQRDNGAYLLKVDSVLKDIAGNSMDQNGNSINGETGVDSFEATFNIDIPNLVLTLSSGTVAEGGVVTCTVTRSDATGPALLVSLASSNQDQASVPAAVTIPAGVASIGFEVKAKDDTLVEPTRIFTLTGSALGHDNGTAALSVLDDDLPTLTFTVENSSIRENAGKAATIGRIQRAKATDQPLQIMLANGDSGSVQIPGSVVIPAGQIAVFFQISAIDNNKVDGNRDVIIAAQALDYSGAVIGDPTHLHITVLDDDVAALQVVIAQKVLPGTVGASVTASVTRNTPASGDDLVVDLISSDILAATVPPSVSILKGQTTATFEVDAGTKPSDRVTIGASAAGYVSGSDWVMVTDRQLPDFQAEQIVLNAPYETKAYSTVSYFVFNRGVKTFVGDIVQRIYLVTDKASPLSGAVELQREVSHVDNLIPGGYFSPTWTVRLPVRADTYWVMVVVDPEGAVTETDEGNNTSFSASSYQIVPAYSAVVYADADVSLPSTPVSLHGTATRLGGSGGGPVVGESVTIHLKVNGTTREIAAITDNSGYFTTLFYPLPGEAGHFDIGASHPGVSEWTKSDEFTILGMKALPAYASPEVTDQHSIQGTLTLANLCDKPLTGLNVVAKNTPANLVITIDLTSSTLNANGTLSVDYTIKAQGPTPAQSLPSLEITCAEGVGVSVPLYVTVKPLLPVLVAYPDSLKAGMLRGGQTMVEFDVVNNGAIESGPIDIALPVSWMVVSGLNPLGTLAPGETNRVTLILSPASDLTVGHYTGNLALHAEKANLTVPFDFVALSSATGSLKVTVVDEYTYYADTKPNVANATVTVTDAVTKTVVDTKTTGTDGTVLFVNLPESYYILDVQAPQHNGYKATFLLQAGIVNEQEAFVSRQTVQYVWTVTPTEIPDRTKITIEAVFETVVPIPLVTVQPTLIDLDTVTGNFMQIDLVVANSGLVAAKDAHLSFPSHPCWELKPVIEDIGEIPAKSSLIIPVLITRKDIAGCSPCAFDGGLTWTLKCANRINTYVVPIHVVNAGHDCGGPVVIRGGGGGGGGGGWVGGGGGGGGGGATYTPPNIVATKDCDCAARVKIRIDQEAVVARDAFKATLELIDGTADPLENIKVDVIIKNRAGERRESLFETKLIGITGMSRVDGEGILSGNSTGVATWLIMPTVDAAPSEPTDYWVGGTLSYVQNGVAVSIPLDPVTITVLPLAQLSLKYFLQRDVFSDDPFTPQVEPSIPFNLAVLVENTGAGLAKALQITSAQPQIIENESGLLIHFDIITTEVSGKNMVPSLVADFGDIQPRSSKVGRWLLKSTLQGLFIDYKATFENLDALGNPKLNIITGVEIHEMNHLVRDMRAGADSLPDFLVHDQNTEDPRDLPDTLYFSNGGKAPVTVIELGTASGSPNSGNLIVTLTIEAQTGWSYVRLPDPGLGNYQLVAVQRGGNSLFADNFWQTDRTFIGRGLRPIREHILHILDYTDSGTATYTLTYTPSAPPELNRPPTAGDYSMSTRMDAANSMSAAKLLRACADPDNDTISIVAVDHTSANGGAITLNNGMIGYTPMTGFVGVDHFFYTVEDSHGASAQGKITVSVVAPTGSGLNILGPPIVTGGIATVRFAGIPGMDYIVEWCDNLTAPIWTQAGRVTAQANGLIVFTDLTSGGASLRFYRLRAP
jgi:hypothetical protein